MKVGIVMSGGFFGFYAHVGFLKALKEQKLIPSAYAGASSGALIGGISAAGVTPEELEDNLNKLKTMDFFDPEWSRLLNLKAIIKGEAGLLRGDRFRKLLSNLLPHQTFENSPNECCIVIKDYQRDKPVYLTTGNLIDAIYAANAVPVMFEPLRKNGKVQADGGYTINAPIQALFDRTHPDLIIVHYIQRNSARHARLYQKYVEERKNVEKAGCRVVEVMLSNSKRVFPFGLGRGKAAMQEGYENAIKTLDGLK
ncbi:MAG: patatin-like phospholipase family protein [Nanoarchaeota archaeon]